jgi:hypothetical protein
MSISSIERGFMSLRYFMTSFSIEFGDTASVAFETNGKGYLGYIVELPGAFIRGETEEEALKKVPREVSSYLRWLDTKPMEDYSVQVIQMHQSNLTVEDADSEILLEADKGALEEGKYKNLLDIVLHSGETFLRIYESAVFRDWVDESRIRKTFYGQNPKTIREIFEHVKRCQYYYLSRMRMEFETEEEDFRKIRPFCLQKLQDLYRQHNNLLIVAIDNEQWTLKKVLRRFIWHERIHARAIMRILERQRRLGVIDGYEDPLFFRNTYI